MKLALISRLHKKLSTYHQPLHIGKKASDLQNIQSNEHSTIVLNDIVTNSLCDNFDLLNELIRTKSSLTSQILQILLDSIGKLDLNALINEPIVNTSLFSMTSACAQGFSSIHILSLTLFHHRNH